jgi:alkyl hydroperoxide reductase subunit AhpC
VAGALTLSGSALAEDAAVATIGKSAPDFTLVDATGNKHTLSDLSGKYVVLEWVNFDCPFVRKHYDSENMPRLQSALGEKEVVWLSICSSAPGTQGYFEGEALTERLKKEQSNAAAYLIDADGSVGRAYDAKVTPHMYVIDPDGILRYAGAIDDRPSTKVADVEGATNYVVKALDALTADEEVETSYTKAYGCSIKYAKP